jgi:AraC-like DNA-binding protein
MVRPDSARECIVTTNRRPALHASRHAERRRYEQIIEKYLRDCYAKRTVARVSELAQLLHAPRPYLSRIVPELFGKSLRIMLRDRQLSEAQRLIRVTPLTLDEIAEASAFGNRSTLFRLFRAAFGITPGAYRRQVTNCDFTRQ